LRSSSTCRERALPRRLLRFLCLFAACCFFCWERPAWAIDPNRTMSQYIHDQWGPDRGFPQGPVYAITQTPDGYIWIGTEAGLIRFDGINFTRVEDTKSSFTIKRVLGLSPDGDGNLWVRLQGPTILKYKNGAFEAPASTAPGDANITAMCRTNRGELLVSRMEQGAFVFRGNKFDLLANSASLPRSPILSIAQTLNGDIWMGTRDSGLFQSRAGQMFAVAKGLPDPKVNCIQPDGDAALWVGTDNGLAHWDGTRFTSLGVQALSNTQILAMIKDRDANLWVGTNANGLIRINSQGMTSLPAREGSAITALFEGRAGYLWVGGANGLQRFTDSIFVTYSTPEGLPSENNGAIYTDAEGRTWFAPIDGGLFSLRNGRVRQVTVDGLGKDVVYSISGGTDGLWIGRQSGGLTHLRPNGDSFTASTYTEANGLPQNSIYAVYQSRNGAIWAGTLSGGVSRFAAGKFITYTHDNGLASNTVTSILEDTEGTMWFGTPDGLSSLSKGQWHVYRVQNGLRSDSVNCLLQDSIGVVWIGTAKGLGLYKDGKVATAPNQPGALNDPILGLAEDRKGWLWIATSNRVLRVHRDKLLNGSIGESSFREFALNDGLRGIEGVKRFQSVVADSLGRIWFSLNRGLSVVDPERLATSVPVLPRLQTVLTDDKEIDLKDRLRIPPRPRRIAFRYAGLYVSAPERIRFRYKLDGFDSGWSDPTSAHEAIYTNLRPGPYRFRLMATNSDGVWSETEDAIAFDIAPAYWQTVAFRVSLVMIGVFLIVAGYRFRLRQMMAQMNVRFEERLAERTRIAQDLHDTLLQGCLSTSMQLHVAADRVPDDSPLKDSVTHVQELISRVINEGRNAVRGLRSATGVVYDLEQVFAGIQKEAALEDVGFYVIVEGTRRPLHPLIRDEIYGIGREAIVNAFRHADAKHIEVVIEYGWNRLRIVVRDDGRGMDMLAPSAGHDQHIGIVGMKERAERIGGRLAVRSRRSSGTEVELLVPGQIAYLRRKAAGGAKQ
jgi:signal transduction histidine kinase/ligand-binding sensor domain-containing protein